MTAHGQERSLPTAAPTPSLPFAPTITHLPPLRPEWWVQLPVREQPVLQAREELQEVPSLGEVEGRPLDPILADQHHCPAAVHCHRDPAQKTQQEVTMRNGDKPSRLAHPPRHAEPDTWTCSGKGPDQGQGRFYLPQVPFSPPTITVDWGL